MQNSFTADVEALDTGFLITSDIFGGRVALGKKEDLRAYMRDMIHQAVHPILNDVVKQLHVTIHVTDVTVEQAASGKKHSKDGGM